MKRRIRNIDTASGCCLASSRHLHFSGPEFPTRLCSKGCGKMANNLNNLVKGSSMRKKLQNGKDYAESPEFLPALGSPSLQLEVN